VRTYLSVRPRVLSPERGDGFRLNLAFYFQPGIVDKGSCDFKKFLFIQFGVLLPHQVLLTKIIWLITFLFLLNSFS
jgi:hypothetical protein